MTLVHVAAIAQALVTYALFLLASRRRERVERELAVARAEVLALEARVNELIADSIRAERAEREGARPTTPYRAAAPRGPWVRRWLVRGVRERDGAAVYLCELRLEVARWAVEWGGLADALPHASADHARGVVKFCSTATHCGDVVRDLRVEEVASS